MTQLFRGLALAGLLTMAGLPPVGCHKPKPPSAPDPVGSTTVALDQAEVQMLPGQLEGPYFFISAVSPSVIELADTNAQKAQFKLIGLSDTAYEPAPAPGATPAPPKAEAELKAEQERAKVIALFKMEAIKKVCGDKPLWVMRLADQPPAPVYLFKPQQVQTDLKHPKGLASLVNAQALRDGVANMELKGEYHAFYDKMLESELVSIIEARKGRVKDGTLWTQFGMKLPDSSLDARLADLDKKVY